MLTALLLTLNPAPPQQAPASFRNILIASPEAKGYPPCEPSIAVSQKDPHNIVAGVILDRAIYTKDGGITWKDVKLTSKYGVFGDPTVISDKDGNFFFFHLTNDGKFSLDRIMSQKSADGGASWMGGDGLGNNPPTQQDKQWATVHPTKPNVYATWTQFDKYAAKEPTFHSNIMFSMSENSGLSWSKGVVINDLPGDCLDDDGTTEGAVPAVGKDGTIHVTWSNQGVIFYDRSKDNGKTWLPHDIPLFRQYGGWNMTIPGIGRANGMPVLMVDNSPGNHNGWLYLLWADQRLGETDTDVLFARSTDGGNTWSKPLTVNKDKAGKHQFFPWLAVDQATGFLYAVYYDRRSYADLKTDVYLAYSKDGGASFKEVKISERPFVPGEKAFFGDYNNISAHKGIIAPIWTRMDEGKTTVWTAVIKQADLP